MDASLPGGPNAGDDAGVVFAAEYPLLSVFGTMVLFFVWGVWVWMVIAILKDVFRRTDLTGGAKAAWMIVLIVLPFLGTLIYLVSNHDGMADREAGG